MATIKFVIKIKMIIAMNEHTHTQNRKETKKGKNKKQKMGKKRTTLETKTLKKNQKQKFHSPKNLGTFLVIKQIIFTIMIIRGNGFRSLI